MKRYPRVDGLPTGPDTLMELCGGDVALVRRIQAGTKEMTNMDQRTRAEMQRKYDRYRDRNGLPLASLDGVTGEELDMWHADETALHEALLVNQHAASALDAAIGAQFAAAEAALGPDPERRIVDVATESQMAEWAELAREGQRLSILIGVPVISGVTADGEGWFALPPPS